MSSFNVLFWEISSLLSWQKDNIKFLGKRNTIIFSGKALPSFVIIQQRPCSSVFFGKKTFSKHLENENFVFYAKQKHRDCISDAL